jgi:hypothetical protein
MVLLVAEEGPLRAAIRNELEATGVPVSVVTATHDDLWSAARKQRAIVYLPAASLLDGKARPRPSEDRMRDVLGAAEAPGVEVVVPVFPATSAYDEEIRAMKRRGKPYAALRAEPLLEEIAELVPANARALYLPRIGAARFCRAGVVARAVVDAIDTETQGRVTDVESERADAARLIRKASENARSHVRVRPLRPWLFRLLRPAFDWLSRAEGRVIDALAWLFPELDRERPALPDPNPH